ncbi:MAG: hypothetical protein WD733_22415 [Bryobacterales bacterium]
MPIFCEEELRSPAMPGYASVSQKQFDRLQGALDKLANRVSSIDGRLGAPKDESALRHPLLIALFVVLATAFVGFQSWMAYSIHTYSGLLTGIEERLGGLEKSLLSHGQRISTIEVSSQLERAAASPTLPESQNAVVAAVAEAQQKGVALPEALVAKTGQQLIETAEKQPSAWAAVLKLITYRSSLNTIKTGTPIFPGVNETHYEVFPPPGLSPPAVFQSGRAGVPISQAARLSRIGETLNEDVAIGPLFMYLKGGAVDLDGMHIRSVAFIGVEVHYSGGPLVLQRATFVDCTFVIENVQRGRRFGESILASTQVDFQT